jgi:hypothetical protein
MGWNTYAQNVIEILDKADRYYLTNSSFEIEMTYKMYRGLQGNTVTESYKGLVQKKDGYSKTTMVDSDIIQYDHGVLLIDHQDKLISYQKHQGSSQNYSPIHLEGFIKGFKKSKVTDKGDYWFCEMINTGQVTQIPYGKVTFHVKKIDYQITKQVLFFNSQIPFKNELGKSEMDFGRLELELKLKNDVLVEETPLNKYLLIDKEGEIILQEEYALYEVLK